MKPVYQSIVTPPNGNCLQACIASILELSLSDVPNFVTHKDWVFALVQFCEHLGLRPVFLDRRGGFVGKNMGYGQWYSVVSGQSPRGDYLHAVVAYDGEVIHDPYPSGGGKLLSIKDEIVFVAMNPALFVHVAQESQA